MPESHLVNLKKKIGHLYNKLRAGDLLGIDLYAILLDDQLIQSINECAVQDTRRIVGGYNRLVNPETIIISLIVIGAKRYDSGSYWEFVHEEYHDLYDKYGFQKVGVENELRNVLRRLAIINQSGHDMRYVTKALIHSIVPLQYISNYYDLMFELYFNDLRGSLPDEEKILHNFLKVAFSQIAGKEFKNDEFKTSIMNKSYSLLRSTRIILETPYYINAIIDFSTIILKSIDTVINIDKEPLPPVYKIFDKLAKDWYETSGREALTYIHDKSKTKNKKPLRWKPLIFFNVQDFKIYLHTQTVFLSKEVDFSLVSIEISSQEKLVFEDKVPEIIDNGLSVELSSQDIAISWDPFDFTYNIKGIDLQCKDFKNDFLLFNQDGKQMVESYYYDGTKFLYTKVSSQIENLGSPLRGDQYNLYIIPNETTHFMIDRQTIFLVKVDKVDFVVSRVNKVIATCNDKPIPFTIDPPTLVIPFHANTQSVLINHNAKLMNLESDQKDAKSLLLEDNNRLGYNFVEVIEFFVDGRENHSIYEYVFDKNLIFEKVEQSGTDFVRLTSILYQKTNEDFRIEKSKDYIELSIQQDNVNIVSQFIVDIPLLYSEKTGFIPLKDYLWHSDYSFYHQVTITGIKAEVLRIVQEDSMRIVQEIPSMLKNERQTFQFDLGAITKLSDSQSNYRLVFINSSETIKIVKFLNHIELLDSNVHWAFSSDSNTINVSINGYIGEGELEVIYASDSKNQSRIVGHNDHEVTFEISKTSLTHSLIFIDHLSQKKIHKIKLYHINKYYPQGIELKITDAFVTYVKKVGRRIVSSHDSFKEPWHTYILLETYDQDKKAFIGRLYFSDRLRRKCFFRNIEKVLLMPKNEFSDAEEMLADINTMDGDGLFFDLEHKHFVDGEYEHDSYGNINEIYVKIVEVNNFE